MTLPIKNTDDRYGLMTILIHWLMAIIIIGLLALGLYMADLPISPAKLKYYGWHKEFGLLVLMLVIVRVTWRLRNINPTLANLPRWEELAARSVHWLFYFFMFANPITGWLISSAAGLPVSFFGLFTFPTLIAASEPNRIFFTGIHEWLAYGLIATVCLHVAAAFKHFLIDRDHIMQRMLWP